MKLIYITLLTISLFLVGCGQQSQQLVTNTIDIKYGKPGAPVALTYTLPQEINAGDKVPVTLSFKSNTAEGTMNASLSTSSEGIVIAGNTQSTLNLNGDKVIEVSLNAVSNGTHYLNVSVQETDANGKRLLGRAFSVPIQVGTTVSKTKINGKLVDDDGEKVIEMNANQ